MPELWTFGSMSIALITSFIVAILFAGDGFSGGPPPPQKPILDRLDRLREPHWTVVPAFVLTVIAVIAAVLSGWFAWEAEIRAERAERAACSGALVAGMSSTNAMPTTNLVSQPKSATPSSTP